MKARKSIKQDAQLPGDQQVLNKLNLTRGMSVNRAIVYASEFIDNQPNPHKFSNAIVQTLKVPLSYASDPGEAKILALATIEQLVSTDEFVPTKVAKIAAEKFQKIAGKLPFLFNKPVEVNTNKRGAKRDVARQIYMENKDLDNKAVIKLIAKELEVTEQNAYTYLYLVKKSLKM